MEESQNQNSVANLNQVKDSIAKAFAKFNLRQKNVSVVVVSKTRSSHEIEPLLRSNHLIFGENKVQEAKQKWLPLREKYKNIELHLIGHLQTNKIKDAVSVFDVIETLDNEKLAIALKEELVAQNKIAMPLFIQVNIGEEKQKSGILPRETSDFVKFCTKELSLNIVGLMCIPPANELSSPFFLLMQKIAKSNKIKYLSMGMSNDYINGALMGASHVRIGTAIFGERGIA